MPEAAVEEREAQLVPERERPRRRRRRGRKAVATVVVLAAGGAVTAAALGYGDRLTAALGIGAGGEAGGPAVVLPPNTATVARQTLKDTETADGELGFGPTTGLTNRLAGTLTHLPATGTRISQGQPLYEVDGRPVLLAYGSMPAYRNLTVDVEGPDVKQLEQFLRSQGYTGFTVDEEYTAATADAVTSWQEAEGLAETGVVELGRVVFAPASVRVDSLEAEEGEPVAARQKLLTYTGTAKAVTVAVDAADQRLAKPGGKVTLTLPDDRTTTGTISEVSTVIEPGTGQDAEPQTKVEVVVAVADQKAVDAYALASVDVTFTSAERKNVLTVPVAALLALQGGGFGVEVVTGSTTRYVAVQAGLFADGRVEVTGAGISAGTVVGMPK